MLILSESEKQDIVDDIDELRKRSLKTISDLVDKLAEVTIENYVNEGDAEVLRTAALSFLIMTDKNHDPSDEEIEVQIEWRDET